jgi:ketosteroid isomerase-like protein
MPSLGERFYKAFLAADEAALSEIVAPGAVLVVRGESRLSGGHRGPQGIAGLRRTISDLTADSWRPLRDDSYDVTESEWHAVVLDKFLAERKVTRRRLVPLRVTRRRLVPFRVRELASHEAFVLAVEDDRIVRLFHYVHDPDAFTSFWA